jgi:anti-sigma B factor antagonist
MAANGLELEVREGEHAVVVVLTGELDMASTEDFATALQRAGRSEHQTTVVDLSALEFIDSSGLATLIKAEHEARDAGRRFVIVRGPRQVQQLLELTGIAERLELVESLDQLPLA